MTAISSFSLHLVLFVQLNSATAHIIIMAVTVCSNEVCMSKTCQTRQSTLGYTWQPYKNTSNRKITQACSQLQDI